MPSMWVGERVRLRGIEPDESPVLMEFDQDTTVMRNAGQVSPPWSVAAYRERAETAARTPDPDLFGVGIESLAEHRLVGMIGTNGVDRTAGVFSYGVGIGAGFHRRGYASEAIVLLLRYMFGERRFQKCDVVVYAYNTASLRLHGKLGFVEEGRRRRARFLGGDYHDAVLMGVTVEEFTAAHPFDPVGSC